MKHLMIIGLWLGLTSCVSTTNSGLVGVNRKQLLIIPADQIEAASLTQYEQLTSQASKQGTLDRQPETLRRLNSIAKALVPQVQVFRPEAKKWAWEVRLISSDQINAFCLPGGKIVFYTGIIEKLKLTDGEIAAIMGHEMAHALREHGRERASEALIKQVGLASLLATGKLDGKYAGLAAQLSTIAVSLPNSRSQESEADEVGVELMARAGYNPFEAISLWKKMGSVGSGKPPELLSTHPSDTTRQRNLASLAPRVMPLYQASTVSSQ